MRDGGSSSATRLEKLCGSTLPQDLITSGNMVYLKFYSGYSTTARGFSLTFHAGTVRPHFSP